MIDRDEARELFERVREPTSDEAELLKQVEPIVSDRRSQPRFIYLDEFLQSADGAAARGAGVVRERGAPGGSAVGEERPPGRPADPDGA